MLLLFLVEIQIHKRKKVGLKLILQNNYFDSIQNPYILDYVKRQDSGNNENCLVIQRADFYETVLLEPFYAHRESTCVSLMMTGLGCHPQHEFALEDSSRNRLVSSFSRHITCCPTNPMFWKSLLTFPERIVKCWTGQIWRTGGGSIPSAKLPTLLSQTKGLQLYRSASLLLFDLPLRLTLIPLKWFILPNHKHPP